MSAAPRAPAPTITNAVWGLVGALDPFLQKVLEDASRYVWIEEAEAVEPGRYTALRLRRDHERAALCPGISVFQRPEDARYPELPHEWQRVRTWERARRGCSWYERYGAGAVWVFSSAPMASFHEFCVACLVGAMELDRGDQILIDRHHGARSWYRFPDPESVIEFATEGAGVPRFRPPRGPLQQVAVLSTPGLAYDGSYYIQGGRRFPTQVRPGSLMAIESEYSVWALMTEPAW